MYDIEYNGVKAEQLDVYVIKRPDIPAPEKNVEVYEIPGRDGSLTYDYGTYKNIEIDIDFNYMAKPDLWSETFRSCKRWLLKKGIGKLIFNDDRDYYYLVKKVTIADNERTSLRIGSFTATFTCHPYHYLVGGDEAVPADKIKYNPYSLSHPVYYITGEGMCILTVNQKSMKANVGQNLTIDTDLQIAYRADGAIMNTTVIGDYEDLYLQEGDNTITITSGFGLSIAPMWRCL